MDKQVRVLVHTDDDGSLWAEVVDMPGVFASGSTLNELFEAVAEAVTMVMLDGASSSADARPQPPAAVVDFSERRSTQSRGMPAYTVQEVDLLIEA